MVKFTGRDKARRVKTAKGRKTGSTLWLHRQLNDPYVAQARREGYRSRAAFKLLEMDERFGLLRKDMRVVDLGAAPGGWSQVAARKGARVVALDILEMEPLEGVAFLALDFAAPEAPERLKALLEGQADLVLSDLAPNTTGHRATDHIRIMGLVELAYDFARDVLAPEGCFVAKVFQGGTESVLLAQMKKEFRTVRHVKPPASRKDSAEQYVVASGFRMIPETEV